MAVVVSDYYSDLGGTGGGGGIGDLSYLNGFDSEPLNGYSINSDCGLTLLASVCGTDYDFR